MQEIKEVQLGNLFTQVITDYMDGENIAPDMYGDIVRELSANLIEAYVEYEKQLEGNQTNRGGDSFQSLNTR